MKGAYLQNLSFIEKRVENFTRMLAATAQW